ncbi:MAG TPA: hypothetical protein H9870_05100 [Candidatus Corynebacterium avicola]|uniref:histidine kinase n=1 Tax=Candidatus Corynebacterium avicola TaxID=2838527 RepID=A0A9D1RMX9_9CORY|nr:hypothetical protein [Candidatus Corynebacterium avicola]
MTTDVTVPETDRQRRVPTWVVDAAIVAVIFIATAVLGPRPSGEPGPQGPPGGGDGAGGWGVPGGGGNTGLDGLDIVGTGIGHYNVHWVIVPVTTVLAALVILLRRRWPVPVAAGTLAIYVFTVLLGAPVIGPGIAAIVASYVVADRTNLRTTLFVGGIGTGIVGVLSIMYSEEMALDPQIFQIAAGIAIASAMGESARSRRSFAQAMTERAERAEQTREAEARRQVAEERLRIAQDLHDTVAHRISVINLHAGVASSALTTNPDKSKESLSTIRTAAREVLGEIGVLLRYLRAEEGVTAEHMPQPGMSEINTLVTTMTDAGLDVSYDTVGDMNAIDELTGRVVYRVAQEGLTNANKHGSGGTATLRIEVGRQEVTVAVSNPVSAADRNQPDAPRGGLGLTGLRERVSSIGGSVSATGASGIFTLSATVPLTRKDQQ